MSVALITNYAPPYRAPLFNRLARELDVEIFFWDRKAAGGEGGRVNGESRPNADPQGFPSASLGRQAAAYRVAQRHDAVVCGLGGRVALPAAYLGARRARVPFVLWASLWSHPRSAAHLLSAAPMRAIYRRADAVVTYGPHVSAYVRRRRTRGGVFEAPQSVEAEIFARPVGEHEVEDLRHELDVSPAPIVLFVGRLVREKGVEVLRDAWRLTGRADGATLLFAGEGPLRGALAGPGVSIAGRLPRERLPVAYAAADLLVLPSIHTRTFTEPWGLVVNEAMHRGVPVVASDAVGAAAGGLVRDEANGLIVPAGDARALAEAIARLLDDAELRRRLGEQGRRDVAAHSYEAMVAGFARALDYAKAHKPVRRRSDH